jgi:hypothetical protein
LRGEKENTHQGNESKMNKKKRRLFMSFTILLILLGIAYYLASSAGYFGENRTTLKQDEYNFRIEDTSAVHTVRITNQDKISVEMTRAENSEWNLNGKYLARIDAINLILRTAKLIDMKSPVPRSARENIMKLLAVNFKKVEFIDEDGDMIKTWYVGNPTKDNAGSYMLLETPDHGKYEQPYVMEIPGFAGELTSRFFVDEIAWRSTVVFAYDPLEIASVKVDNFDNISEGFEIRSPFKSSFRLFDYKGKEIPKFDTVAVRAYLVNYKKIPFETFNKGTLTKSQEDSLLLSRPYYKVEVTDRQGTKKEITIFHKTALKDDVDAYGIPYEFDTQRAYALLQSGEFVVIQFDTFDKILWPVQAFLRGI